LCKALITLVVMQCKSLLVIYYVDLKLHPWCSHNKFLTIGIYLIQKSFFVEMLKFYLIFLDENMNNYFLNVKLLFFKWIKYSTIDSWIGQGNVISQLQLVWISR
jgi:hypothetical protein